jgi:hypothetical protein
MTEKQEFIFTCADEDELEKLKTRAMKLKVILLDTWDKHPLQNPALFNKRQRDRFTSELKSMWNSMTDEQIDKEFNEICCERLFVAGADFSNYPVYEPVGTANHKILYDAGLNAVEVVDNN